MTADEKIRTMLTSAGMLMEDVSARLILDQQDLAATLRSLRDTAHDLLVIANTVEVIDRQRQQT